MRVMSLGERGRGKGFRRERGKESEEGREGVQGWVSKGWRGKIKENEKKIARQGR